MMKNYSIKYKILFLQQFPKNDTPCLYGQFSVKSFLYPNRWSDCQNKQCVNYYPFKIFLTILVRTFQGYSNLMKMTVLISNIQISGQSNSFQTSKIMDAAKLVAWNALFGHHPLNVRVLISKRPTNSLNWGIARVVLLTSE